MKEELKNIVSKAVIWKNIPDSHTEYQEEQIGFVVEELYKLILQEKSNHLRYLIDNFGYYCEKAGKYVLDHSEVSSDRLDIEKELEGMV